MQRDGDERRQEGADDAAGRGQGEDAPRDAAGVLHAGRGQADGERRRPCRAGSPVARTAASDAAKEPTTAPTEIVSMPLHGEVEEGPRDEGDRGDQCGARPGRSPPADRRWVAVGEPAAEPVAERQRDQDQPDDVGPDHRRGAVVGRQQARGADLGGHRADAGEEDEGGQGARAGGRRRARHRPRAECGRRRGRRRRLSCRRAHGVRVYSNEHAESA